MTIMYRIKCKTEKSVIQHIHSNCIFFLLMTTEGLKITRTIDGNALPTYSNVAIVGSGANGRQPQYF